MTCLSALNAVPRSDVLYYITDPTKTETFGFALTPSGCPNELTITMTLADGSPLPAAITYTPPNTFDVFEAAFLNVATYSVKVSASDPKTGLTAEQTFKVFVMCIRGFQTTAPMADLSYLIDINTSWALPFTLPVFTSTPPGCDISTFTFSVEPAPLPVWLTETSPNNWAVET